MDSIYCSDQIEVPEALPAILKAYTKEVIRFGPKDIVAFSRDYFASLASGEIEDFLQKETKKKTGAEEIKAME
jgi:hypothetical protein